ncbi:TetR family transcriptional regulator [Kribbella orskensis]|uniref:TetR family transcriptional regulator n=1 Tax=Kribbella orskensis TaxID=2512216 RepID=A0ABY2BLD4_9ACTN|nr:MULTISPECIES: TetR/AcrR family transcriptional regulator [Kribbella]TCN40824.1 TetR family transcriptional regulator [Kribbella sp. VKM Ac-2500]TCO24076.1 TetR family transcriptional regulator [Kribbella orskensis]
MTTVVPGRRTRRQSELLDRLLSLFLTQGFSRFTLDDLAAELRCSKTTLYALAPSKEQLAVEVVKHYFKNATAEVESAVGKQTRPDRRIAAYLNAVADALRPATRTFLDDVATFAPARSVYERNTRIAADRVRSLIEEGIDSKAFRQVDIGFAAEMIAHTMQAIQRGDIARRTGLTDAEAYRELASFVLHSLRHD